MPIEFHCQYCRKQIRAADEHAGKHGKCPSCHQEVYIPTPPEQIELLKLAPLDEDFERRQAALLEEERRLRQRLLHEREVPGERGRPAPAQTGDAPARPAAQPAVAALSDSQLETLVVEYVICMSDGSLEEAEELAGEIRKHAARADGIVSRMMMDEIPPAQLTSIPRPVLLGFLRQLKAG